MLAPVPFFGPSAPDATYLHPATTLPPRGQAGELPPPQPELEQVDDAAQWFLTERQRRRHEAKEALAWRAPEVQHAATEREAELYDELRRRLGDIDAVVDELTALGDIVKRARAAQSAAARDRRGELNRDARTVGVFNVHTVVNAALGGAVLLSLGER